MKIKLPSLILTFALTSLSSFGAEKISGSMKILSPTTNKEITTARIGQQIKVRIAVNNLNLIANKNVKFTYALSVLPKGSDTPISFSGKISGPFKLPASEGGAAKTKEEMASWDGMQVGTELITIPDILPAGKATLSVSLSGNKVGTITFNENLKIQL
jgi:hypothetical protein